MIRRICGKFPITPEQIMTWANESSAIFRVHIMRVLLEQGYCKTVYGSLYRSLFSRTQGDCWVPVKYPETLLVARAARASGAVVALAHPCVYDSFDIAHRLARAGLIDAMETDYPRKVSDTADQHERIIQEYNLIATGGTDFHGFYSPDPHPIGTCCTGDSSIQRIQNLSEKRKHE
jgi:predicted metal-dependent phosphoesterase TrpH